MRVVSLFSGAGGLDLGLVQAGLQIVWANDIFEDAAETYRRNIGDHIDTRDICDIESGEIPDCDVVVGGFPCQGFSVANWGRSMQDPRNQMYKQLLRVVREKQPKYFLAENVKGLASMSGGAVLRTIIGDFEHAGYRVRHKIVNAADYGVPQARMRILILGVRIDLDAGVAFPPVTDAYRSQAWLKERLQKLEVSGKRIGALSRARYRPPDSKSSVFEIQAYIQRPSWASLYSL